MDLRRGLPPKPPSTTTPLMRPRKSTSNNKNNNNRSPSSSTDIVVDNRSPSPIPKASDALPLPLYLTNGIFFTLFFCVAYFLLHRWRDNIRSSTPLHVVTLSELAAIVSLIASFIYLLLIPSYSLESKLGDCRRAASIRPEALESKTGRLLLGLPLEGFDYDSILGKCCEMPIGYVQVPVGIAGPLLLNGGEYMVPMATTEAEIPRYPSESLDLLLQFDSSKGAGFQPLFFDLNTPT